MSKKKKTRVDPGTEKIINHIDSLRLMRKRVIGTTNEDNNRRRGYDSQMVRAKHDLAREMTGCLPGMETR